MKIADVEAIWLQSPIPPAQQHVSDCGRIATYHVTVVIVTTEDAFPGYGDANAIVVDMAREVLLVVKGIAVLAGVCSTYPFRLIPVFLREIKEMRFDGVQNFPTVGLFDGSFRANLAETGVGYGLEVEMIRQARELDPLTWPYVFTVDEARAMAEASMDVLVPHMGLTTKGSIGTETAPTLDEATRPVQTMRDAATAVNPDIIVL